MKLGWKRNFLGIVHLAIVIVLLTSLNVAQAEDNGGKDGNRAALRGRIVAVGIPGAGSISAVGTFLPGGPIHDKPALHAFTAPGQMLDPVRILVGSSSNFGAPLARTDQLPGSFLSIDPTGSATLVVPADFASAGGQASTLGGSVQVFTANNAAFLNGIANPNAVTANFTGASNPLGISMNWAFGRLWPVNAPNGLNGIGTSTILDPQGFGLAGAPNAKLGGVYADNLTNRGVIPPSAAQVIPGGLNTGGVATAFMGASPDGSKKAVFFVVEADGSIVQEHTLQGLDGLVPPGTISSLIGRQDEGTGDGDGSPNGVTPREGVVLNWTPTLNLFVSEPFDNRITVLDIAPNAAHTVFTVTGIHHINSDAFNKPVDMAPVVDETDDTNFSSNTTLNEGSDIYVANRGDNTIVRMRQDGTIVAVRQVQLADGSPLGDARINGIATSPSSLEENATGTVIWVTVTGHLPGVPHSTGAVLELPAF
jgi:hypothetical protein